MNSKFYKLFKEKKPIIGMIHLAGDEEETIPRALKELEIFQKEGLSGAIIENYLGTEEQVEETLKQAQKKKFDLILGINILPNEYFKSFALADKYGAKFVQLDYVAGRYLNGGFVNGKRITYELDVEYYLFFKEKYPDIAVLGGVHPKYYKPAPESNLEQELKNAMQRADAIVVTGQGTGLETPIEKIKQFREIIGCDFPLLVGAGLTAENARAQLSFADGAIVGSALKTNNKPVNHVDVLKVGDLVSAVRLVRKNGNGKKGNEK